MQYVSGIIGNQVRILGDPVTVIGSPVLKAIEILMILRRESG